MMRCVRADVRTLLSAIRLLPDAFAHHDEQIWGLFHKRERKLVTCKTKYLDDSADLVASLHKTTSFECKSCNTDAKDSSTIGTFRCELRLQVSSMLTARAQLKRDKVS